MNPIRAIYNNIARGEIFREIPELINNPVLYCRSYIDVQFSPKPHTISASCKPAVIVFHVLPGHENRITRSKCSTLN